MVSAVRLTHKRGQAPPPLEVGTAVELTRSGDDVARDIFAALTDETGAAAVTAEEWKRAERLILSERPGDQTAAGYILDKITRGTVRQRNKRAKKAACLILHTLAGFTMEQLGIVFNHPKGHISRLVREAAEEYRQATAAPTDPAPTPEQTVARLSIRRSLNFRDRHRLKRMAERIARKVLTLTPEERAFLVPFISHVI
jgi:hypothetical protein